MFTLRTREDQDAYARQNMGLPDDPQRMYIPQHSLPRYPQEDPSAHYSPRRFADSSHARFQDHLDYPGPIPQSLPSMASARLGEMTRIDTSSHFTRRDSPGDNRAGPLSASVDLSPDSEAWSPAQSRPRKSRREKPRIELAPDQPPTTQGKPRARVYVACLQWFVLSLLAVFFCLNLSPVEREKFVAMVPNLYVITVASGPREVANAITTHYLSVVDLTRLPARASVWQEDQPMRGSAADVELIPPTRKSTRLPTTARKFRPSPFLPRHRAKTPIPRKAM
jgi:hypothetical protein